MDWIEAVFKKEISEKDILEFIKKLPLFLISIFVFLVTVFGLSVVKICLFDLKFEDLPLSDLGAFFGGVAAIIGLYSLIQKYFDSQKKSRKLKNLSKAIDLLLNLRSFLKTMFFATAAFQKGNPFEQNKSLVEYRNSEIEKNKKVIELIKTEASSIDAIFNKEIIDLFTEVLEKWESCERYFKMWKWFIKDTPLVEKDVVSCFNQSYLSVEEYSDLKLRIDNIIREINPNYNKPTSMLDFEGI